MIRRNSSTNVWKLQIFYRKFARKNMFFLLNTQENGKEFEYWPKRILPGIDKERERDFSSILKPGVWIKSSNHEC